MRISTSKGRCGLPTHSLHWPSGELAPAPVRPGRCPRPSAPAGARDRRVSNRVLIAGATGFIGRRLAQRLPADGLGSDAWSETRPAAGARALARDGFGYTLATRSTRGRSAAPGAASTSPTT